MKRILWKWWLNYDVTVETLKKISEYVLTDMFNIVTCPFAKPGTFNGYVSFRN